MANEFIERIVYEADIADVRAKLTELERRTGATAGAQERAARRSTQAWERFATRFSKVGDKASRAGTLMSTRISLPLAALGAVAFKAASDLGEQMSKVNAVFKEGGAEVQAWAKTTVGAFGVGRRRALEAAGTFGNLFTAMKLPNKEAVKMSTRLTELAGDLSSFNDVSVDDALLALRSGLVGESEPLRRFAVQISEARVQQEALSLGLIKSTKNALTPATKAQAIYSLIMQDTASAQGDYARTADSAANRLRNLRERFEDSAATLGERVLPHAERFLGFAVELLDKFDKLSPATQGFIIKAAAIGIILGPAVKMVGALSKGIGGLFSVVGFFRRMGAAKVADAAASTVATGANARLAASLHAVSAAQGRAAVGASAHAAALQLQATAAATVGSRLGMLGGLLGKAFLVVGAGAGIANVAINHFSGGFKDLIGQMETSGATVDQMNKVLGNLSGATTRQFAQELASSTERLEVAANAAFRAGTLSAETHDKIRNWVGAAAGTKDVADNVLALNASWRLVRETVEGGTDAIAGVAPAADKAAASVSRLAGADFKDWRNKTVDALNGVKGVLGELAGKSKLSAKDILKSFTDQLTAQKNYRANWEKLLQRKLPEDLKQQIAEMGLEGAGLVAALARANDKQFNSIIAKWNEAGQVATGTLRNSILGIKAAIDQLPTNKQLRFSLQLDLKSINNTQLAKNIREEMAGRAAGGPVRKGVPYRVGEEGEETFVPDQNGWILPNRSLNLASSSSPMTNISPAGSDTRAMQQLSAKLDRLIALEERVLAATLDGKVIEMDGELVGRSQSARIGGAAARKARTQI